jgi:hypothetical protein
MLFAGIVLLLSGIVLWIPETLPWSLRDVRYAAILLHVCHHRNKTPAFSPVTPTTVTAIGGDAVGTL